MSYHEKYNALYEYLSRRGHIDRYTSLAVKMRLCEEDRWCEKDVTWLWANSGCIYYSTPSFVGCILSGRCEYGMRNAAYLYDQLPIDRNLF